MFPAKGNKIEGILSLRKDFYLCLYICLFPSSLRRMDDGTKLPFHALNLLYLSTGFSAKGTEGPATWRWSCSSRVLLMWAVWLNAYRFSFVGRRCPAAHASYYLFSLERDTPLTLKSLAHLLLFWWSAVFNTFPDLIVEQNLLAFRHIWTLICPCFDASKLFWIEA